MLLQTVFSFIAGILTAVSPCVLPVLPLIFASSSQTHRLGPVFLILGLSISFVVVGISLSILGPLMGVDIESVKKITALLLVLLGVILLLPSCRLGMERALGPLSQKASSMMTHVNGSSLWSQAVIGVLLGAVWSPCVGPTLGAATLMASQMEKLPQALWIMIVFSVGSAIPLLLIAYSSRRLFMRLRDRMSGLSNWLKPFLGTVLILIGLFVFFGFDRTLEAVLLENLPESWVRLITRF